MGKRLETKFRISLLYPAPIGMVWSGGVGNDKETPTPVKEGGYGEVKEREILETWLRHGDEGVTAWCGQHRVVGGGGGVC